MSKGGFGKFAVGALVGVGLGVLLAPKEGSKTREELKCKIDELCQKVKELNKEDVQAEIEMKIEKLKKEIEGLNKEKVLKVAKEKGQQVKDEAQRIVDLAKEKGTPVLEKTATEVREKAIDVTKNVLNKLEEKDKEKKN